MKSLRISRFLLALLLVAFGTFLFLKPTAYADASDEIRTVYVSDVDGLLAEIQPNTEIILAPGQYNLTTAANYGRGGAAYYHWESGYDGFELVITDIETLIIRGESQESVTICTEPRYSYIVRFEDCADITLSDLTIGHTEAPGFCTGGVLYFMDCSQLTLYKCALYGCGIRGIDLIRCRDVHVDWSDIYECTDGAVSITGSSNVLMENSKFYHCEAYFSVFEIETSRDVAIINSEIFGNKSLYGASLFRVTCPGVYFGGLDVHDNELSWLFDSITPITVEKSRFFGNYAGWFSDSAPVLSDGTVLSERDLENMSLRIVNWEAAEEEPPAPLEPAADGKIHVRTVDEFLNAIGNNVTIYLEPGIYDLSTASGYGGLGTEHYYWQNTYDGPELVITYVTGLTIEGASPDQVSITAVPRYANVLYFENSTALILRGFTAGHTSEPGECSGGVLYFTSDRNVNVENCSLYGCGIVGVWAMDCRDMSVLNTEIFECSSGAAWYWNCQNVDMTGCNVHDIDGMLYDVGYGCSDIYVDGVDINTNYETYEHIG